MLIRETMQEMKKKVVIAFSAVWCAGRILIFIDLEFEVTITCVSIVHLRVGEVAHFAYRFCAVDWRRVSICSGLYCLAMESRK